MPIGGFSRTIRGAHLNWARPRSRGSAGCEGGRAAPLARQRPPSPARTDTRQFAATNSCKQRSPGKFEQNANISLRRRPSSWYPSHLFFHNPIRCPWRRRLHHANGRKWSFPCRFWSVLVGF